MFTDRSVEIEERDSGVVIGRRYDEASQCRVSVETCLI